MSKIRVSAVMFYNTLPMVYGLKNSEILNEIELSLDSPADCAKKLISDEADIGLVPIATIPQIPNARIFTDYCIGANGKVRTVAFMSEQPKENIQRIVLDSHSRTSVNLIKIIAREFWNKEFEYIQGNPGFENTDIKGNTAGVVIGDKVFSAEKKFPVIIDLAEEWQKYAQLPFVFASWVSSKKLDQTFISKFNKAMDFGLNHIEEAVEDTNCDGVLTQYELYQYLTRNIDFYLDEQKQKAMSLFLQKLKQLNSQNI